MRGFQSAQLESGHKHIEVVGVVAALNGSVSIFDSAALLKNEVEAESIEREASVRESAQAPHIYTGPGVTAMEFLATPTCLFEPTAEEDATIRVLDPALPKLLERLGITMEDCTPLGEDGKVLEKCLSLFSDRFARWKDCASATASVLRALHGLDYALSQMRKVNVELLLPASVVDRCEELLRKNLGYGMTVEDRQLIRECLEYIKDTPTWSSLKPVVQRVLDASLTPADAIQKRSKKKSAARTNGTGLPADIEPIVEVFKEKEATPAKKSTNFDDYYDDEFSDEFEDGGGRSQKKKSSEQSSVITSIESPILAEIHTLTVRLKTLLTDMKLENLTSGPALFKKLLDNVDILEAHEQKLCNILRGAHKVLRAYMLAVNQALKEVSPEGADEDGRMMAPQLPTNDGETYTVEKSFVHQFEWYSANLLLFLSQWGKVTKGGPEKFVSSLISAAGADAGTLDNAFADTIEDEKTKPKLYLWPTFVNVLRLCRSHIITRSKKSAVTEEHTSADKTSTGGQTERELKNSNELTIDSVELDAPLISDLKDESISIYTIAEEGLKDLAKMPMIARRGDKLVMLTADRVEALPTKSTSDAISLVIS